MSLISFGETPYVFSLNDVVQDPHAEIEEEWQDAVADIETVTASHVIAMDEDDQEDAAETVNATVGCVLGGEVLKLSDAIEAGYANILSAAFVCIDEMYASTRRSYSIGIVPSVNKDRFKTVLSVIQSDLYHPVSISAVSYYDPCYKMVNEAKKKILFDIIDDKERKTVATSKTLFLLEDELKLYAANSERTVEPAAHVDADPDIEVETDSEDDDKEVDSLTEMIQLLEIR